MAPAWQEVSLAWHALSASCNRGETPGTPDSQLANPAEKPCPSALPDPLLVLQPSVGTHGTQLRMGEAQLVFLAEFIQISWSCCAELCWLLLKSLPVGTLCGSLLVARAARGGKAGGLGHRKVTRWAHTA